MIVNITFTMTNHYVIVYIPDALRATAAATNILSCQFCGLSFTITELILSLSMPTALQTKQNPQHCKKGPGWNDPMTAVVPRVKGFACYGLSFSRHNKNIKMEHFFLYILSRYFIWLHKMKRVLMISVHH